MKYEEAKKIISDRAEHYDMQDETQWLAEALRVGVEAVEKQIPKKPIIINCNGKKILYCPICKELLIKLAGDDCEMIFQEGWCPMNYCDRCGQAIYWSEIDWGLQNELL